MDAHWRDAHVAGLRDPLEALPPTDSERDLVAEAAKIQTVLKTAKGIQLGDRRMPYWRALTIRAADNWIAAGEAVEAVQSLRAGLEVDPRNIEFRRRMASALIEVGDPESLRLAELELDYILERFPESHAARVVQARLARAQGNVHTGARIIWSGRVATGQSLANRWQAFVFGAEQPAQRTSFTRLEPLDSSGRFQALFAFEALPEAIRRLRVDPPPDAQGTCSAVRWRWTDPAGQVRWETEGPWVGANDLEVDSAGAWVLNGQADPRVSIDVAPPLQPGLGDVLEFSCTLFGPLPPDLAQALGAGMANAAYWNRARELASEWIRDGITPRSDPANRGESR